MKATEILRGMLYQHWRFGRARLLIPKSLQYNGFVLFTISGERLLQIASAKLNISC